MDSIMAMIGVTIVLSPFILLILKLKKDEGRAKNVAEVFKELESLKNINVTKELFISWKKNFEKIIIDDENRIVYYITINRKNFKDIDIKEIKYNSILKCELIWDTHMENIEEIGLINNKFVQEEKIHREGIRLTLNDVRNPKIDILFTEPSSGSMVTCKELIEEWIAVFEVVLTKTKN